MKINKNNKKRNNENNFLRTCKLKNRKEKEIEKVLYKSLWILAIVFGGRDVNCVLSK